ncbi:MAG: sigma-54-dependent Fis family transcriptional regulator [Planctomycetes bacterium]|nr:sigma-54-dependent Fis family transcriptional regulator [Planctomycetota bacterium]
MKQKNLTANDKEFFSLVSEAAFANPFSHQRIELDRKISGSPQSTSRKEAVAEAVRKVNKRIEKLDDNGTVKIQDFKKTDSDLIEHLFLFDVFHQFVNQFDQLIIDQIAAGEKSISVPFAKEALYLLTRRGFSQPLANRYFSLFYQIRRAFHFINRGLLGQCNSMMMLRTNLWNNIFTHDIRYYERYLWDKMEDFSTLLLGPTGCGKGAAAAAIGQSGFIPFDEKKQTFAESFTKTFIPINLSQYPETLLESELFGHNKGAFTGAVESHNGVFTLCGPHGSIFLDEIGDVSIQVQIKLLKILEERIFSPVGGHKKCHFHGRVIAATNKSLEQLRQKEKFRDDFYYRLCSDCITVPSLQQRIQENPSELDELIAHTVERITGHKAEDLVGTVKEVIDKNLGEDYHWPGNVRELAQCVRRVVIKRDYTGTAANSQDTKTRLLAEIDSGKLNAQDLLAAYCTMLYQKYGTYEQAAQVTQLDRRTVKKYIEHSSTL